MDNKVDISCLETPQLLEMIHDLQDTNRSLQQQLNEKVIELEVVQNRLDNLSELRSNKRTYTGTYISENKPYKDKPILLINDKTTHLPIYNSNHDAVEEEFKTYNRELHSRPELILSTFFRKLYFQLSSHNQTPKEFLNRNLKTSQLSFTFTQFIETLENERIFFGPNEIEAVFELLKDNDVVSADVILHSLIMQSEDHTSNKSSDISSPPSNPEINFTFSDSQISRMDIVEILEKLSVQVMANYVSKEDFREKCFSLLPREVKMANLVKLLLDRESRIEDGPNRNKVASYFMRGKEIIPRDLLIEDILNELFQFESEEQLIEDKNEITQIFEMKAEFIDICEALDTNKTGYVSWIQIEDILQSLKIELSSTALKQFEIKCFSLSKSFNFVPYRLIFDAPIKLLDSSLSLDEVEIPKHRPSFKKMITRKMKDTSSEEEAD